MSEILKATDRTTIDPRKNNNLGDIIFEIKNKKYI